MMSPLHAERLRRGWGRGKLACLLQTAAQANDVGPIATRPSLVRMIQRYERNDLIPAEPYRSLLCEVYGKPPAAFGWLDPTASAFPSASWPLLWG
ncbi:hypothetical protein ACIBKY_35600 [Nonomuraea sp. NPDC050394]|uniref:hypothetical protein n=1 Tax=Nonomuraea sp. NPDC050394 TaxID=3364363 RepID=UPI0037A6F6F3